jgi:hypothetical protein
MRRLPGRGGRLGPKAEPAHAAVDLEPGGERPLEPGEFEHPQLARLVHDDLEAEARARRQLVGLERALEQEDRPGGPGLPQRQGLLDAGHAQHVGRREGGQDARGAVAVGVRLDHRHDPAAAGAPTRHGEVVAQRRKVDHRRGRPHDALLGSQAARA